MTSQVGLECLFIGTTFLLHFKVVLKSYHYGNTKQCQELTKLYQALPCALNISAVKPVAYRVLTIIWFGILWIHFQLKLHQVFWFRKNWEHLHGTNFCPIKATVLFKVLHRHFLLVCHMLHRSLKADEWATNL